ncbi:MAG: biotin/lipoyl-binding protein, partial [Tabrizicola sp.]
MTDTRPDLAQLARMTPPRRRWPWGLLFLFALGAGIYFYTADSPAAPVRYETTPVKVGDLTVTVIATGTVQPTTRVDISSELSGTLAMVEVDFNDDVREGQVLARLDDATLMARLTTAEAQLIAAAARVTQAEATAAEASQTWIAAQELDQRGLSTRSAVISAKAANDRALAAVEIAKADL